MIDRTRFAVATLFLSLFFAVPLLAQAAHQVRLWDVDYGERRCALMRLLPGERPATFSLRIIPGNQSPELHFVDPARTQTIFPGVQSVEITFFPSGRMLRGRGSYTRLEAGGPWVLEINSLPPVLLDRFAESASVSIRAGGRTVAEIAVPQAAAAVHALRDCNDALLRSWGVDPGALAALQRPPEAIGGWNSFFDSSDYPAEAVRNGISGMATMRIRIDADGRISDCAVLVSSGDPLLDQASCRVLRARARLRPALDNIGRPVAVTWVQNVGWATLPRSR